MSDECPQNPEIDLSEFSFHTVDSFKDAQSIVQIDLPLLIKDCEKTSIVEFGDTSNFIIFLDIDGVLNCQEYFQTEGYQNYREAKKQMRKDVKNGDIERLDYYKGQICPDRIKLLNKLCKDLNAVVVISSTWRNNKSIELLQTIFDYCGGEFRIIGKTDFIGYQRGVEIHQWLKDNAPKCDGKFTRYAIIDDDSDMLLSQQAHFFQTNNRTGLTSEICNNIVRFANGEPTILPPPAEYTKLGYAILRNMKYKTSTFKHENGETWQHIETRETGLKLDFVKKRLYDGLSAVIDARNQLKDIAPEDDFVIVEVYFSNDEVSFFANQAQGRIVPVEILKVSNSDK